MCQPEMSPRSSELAECTGGCCRYGPGFRRFFSSKEEKERLENYRDQLKKELVGVEESIKGLKGK